MKEKALKIINFWKADKKLNKYKNDTIDTVILSDRYYRGDIEYTKNITINNFIVNYDFKKSDRNFTDIAIRNTKCKNIYIGEKNNNTDLNISLDYLIRHNIDSITISWEPDKTIFSNIEKLNISYEGEKYSIDLKKSELRFIDIKKEYNTNFKINVKHQNSCIFYKIDSKSMTKKIDNIFITKDELNNGELDLTNFKDFNALALGDLNVNMFKINKCDIKELKYVDLYEYFYIENIKVVDQNEMKLNPEKIIPFNDELDIHGKYILSDKNKILIYVDSKNNLKVFDKNEILKDEKIEQVDFIKKNEDYIVIYQSNNKYKLFIDDKEYNITRLFMYYFKRVGSKYINKVNDIFDTFEAIPHDYEGFVDIISNYLTTSEIIDICEGYLIFKDNLKKLFQRGFTLEYFMYLHERKLDAVIFEMCKDSFDISKFNNQEIETLNDLGKVYVKKLKK